MEKVIEDESSNLTTVCRQIRKQSGRLKQPNKLCKIFKLHPIVVQRPPIEKGTESGVS
jgi:hypothetical protein